MSSLTLEGNSELSSIDATLFSSESPRESASIDANTVHCGLSHAHLSPRPLYSLDALVSDGEVKEEGVLAAAAPLASFLVTGHASDDNGAAFAAVEEYPAKTRSPAVAALIIKQQQLQQSADMFPDKATSAPQAPALSASAQQAPMQEIAPNARVSLWASVNTPRQSLCHVICASLPASLLLPPAPVSAP